MIMQVIAEWMKLFAYILHRSAHNYDTSFSICASDMSCSQKYPANETNEVPEREQRFSSVVLHRETRYNVHCV